MQAGSVDRVEVGTVHDRRGVIALAVVAVLLVAAVVWIATDDGPASGEVPLAAVATYTTKLDCHSGSVVPDNGEQVVPFDREHADSVLGPGGELTLTLQGLANRSVVLHDATVRVERRSGATPGMFLTSGCDGAVDPRYFAVDLDRPQPVLVAQPGSATFPFRVNDVEPEQFVITPGITEGYVEWRLVIRWSSGADTGELVVGDGDRPFRTTALSAVTRMMCVNRDKTARGPC
ncbi:hypothetical protein [Saccharothrix variisporea]|uniref:Uncharacterized protein n=1 Tax=Saccharothrix variisporea TaxID=543527 RepID=A0A495XJL4_9PSEU|nr:hypothetical protein [Saccharothrix variisporea]RKT73004.1 hypothetical protein DFJ66_6330 [Saccharothrix variisporea]